MDISEIRNIAIAVALAAKKETPQASYLYEDYQVLEATISLNNQLAENNTRSGRDGSPKTIVIDL
jgi:hypothetical protein